MSGSFPTFFITLCVGLLLPKRRSTSLYLIFVVASGRVYLGMHSPIDILAGGVIGNLLLLGWCLIDNYLDAFIISGENGTFLSVFDKGFIL